MPNSTPAPKAQSAKAADPTQSKTQRAKTRKLKTKPKVISRQVFSDFASI